jgi:peptide/nickel transport system permease protein
MRDFVLVRAVIFIGAVLGAALVLFVFLDLVPGASPAGTGIDARLIALFGTPDQWQRLAVTLPLVLLALAIAALGGIGLSRLPVLRSGVATVLAVLPAFWLGMLLSLLVAGVWHLLPPSGFVPWDSPVASLASLLLPALALGLPYAGHAALKLQERPAPGWPAILGRTFAALLVSATLVETVFYLPGLGRLVLSAAQQHDLATLRAGLFMLVLIGATGLLLAALSRLLVEKGLRQ